MTHPTDDLTPDLFAPGAATATETETDTAVQDEADLALSATGDDAPADAADLGLPAPGPAAPPAPPQAPVPFVWDGESPFPLHRYAEDAYLRYAMSVVRSRAIPDTADGMKPVQRRIIFAMHELGLNATTKPVKSARVVGDVIGKYHPHGDTAVYDAMVRVAQDFSLRYPLVDGHGNFGSRDGDGAAAMRYTECRLTPIAQLLLAEIDKGTVDFQPNYDGAFKEPQYLPARLPMLLLNGASGIAVGMATEIPSHNLREVAKAAVALLRKPELTTAELLEHVQGPDYPGGGQIISTAAEIRDAYESGRGSLKVRARYTVEELARGQWQLVVTELPPGTSSQKVLEEIEELTNPKVKKGKKTLTQEQSQTKQLILAQLDRVRDESDKDHAVRLVFEPRSSKLDAQEFATLLLAHTSLETSASINLVALGLDGRPGQRTLRGLLEEWTTFRRTTVQRRCEHRLGQVEDRIHILEGRRLVLLNIDEVIALIRESDEPKADLIVRFHLTERQAEDILEIRLRQLARLEAIKIEQELSELEIERAELNRLLDDPAAMTAQIIKEIKDDAAKYGDERRTVIEEASRAQVTQAVVDEPVTVILSKKGFIRTRQGHGVDLGTITFKEGDGLFATSACRTVDQAILLLDNGRACSIPVASIPGGRGDGAPITSMIDTAGAKLAAFVAGPADLGLLIATSAGYGFTCRLGDMIGRTKAGKQFVTVDDGAAILPPTPLKTGEVPMVAALSSDEKLLIFPLLDVKDLSGGGKGVILMGLADNARLISVAVVTDPAVVVEGTGRAGAKKVATIAGGAIGEYLSQRARKGKKTPDAAGKPVLVRAVEENKA